MWPFLQPADRAQLLPLPLIQAYAHLRRDASVKRHEIRSYLEADRLPPAIEPPLDHFRAWFMGAALLSFNFDYGDLIRWLGGEYTDMDRDFRSVEATISAVRDFPVRPGHPAVDYERAFRIVTEGAPLKGQYQCPRSDTVQRIIYDNHPPLRSVLDVTRAKFGKEEARSLHLAFPRFIAFFLPGLMIAPISWVVRKGKGRIVVDASSTISDNDRGNVNAQIPKQGSAGHADECPKVYYGNAFARVLEHIWNLRIDHPSEEILLHVDDIDAAFRRIVYHPDAALAFAYVFQEFIIAPVGQIFGARNAPSFWCVPAEVRAHAAACLDYSERAFAMEADMTFPDPPSETDIASFAPAVADAVHHGIPPSVSARPGQVMFVDDNIAIAIAHLMRSALRGAVGSADDMFQNPLDKRRPPVLADNKWDMDVSHKATYLGLLLNTRRLSVSLPPEKVAEILSICEIWLNHPREKRTPKELARLLGLIQNAGRIMPLGKFFTLQVQFLLNAAIAKNRARSARALRTWWQHHYVTIPHEVRAHIALLRQLAKRPSMWERPIAMLVAREPTCEALSDAAYSGMGGWSPDLSFFWRLTRDDLETCNFNMRELDLENARAADMAKGTDELHINTLEFVGVIINLWFSLHFLARAGSIRGGHILLLRADNTTAISWFQHAARSRRAPLRNLCLLCEALLALSHSASSTQINIKHIPGKHNDEADALSRPELYSTIDSVTTQYSRLRTCRGFLVPYALLLQIAKALSSTQTVAGLVNETTQLLALAPLSLPIGADGMVRNGGFSKRQAHQSSSH